MTLLLVTSSSNFSASASSARVIPVSGIDSNVACPALAARRLGAWFAGCGHAEDYGGVTAAEANQHDSIQLSAISWVPVRSLESRELNEAEELNPFLVLALTLASLTE